MRNPYNNQPFRDPQSIPETTPADFEPVMGQSNSLMSFLSPNETPVTPIAPSTGKSSFSMNDIKGFIDRMGGIDGIVSTLSKVQKVMQSVSQMAPMVKLMADTLLPRKKKKKGDDDDDFPTKRRRRRKRSTNPKSSPKGKARKRPSAPYKK
ncbi:hypothetical protein [Paenibacillus selenitireducens]|uniref:hypothetical protein n=1 Tax=Paenibacillus selenitireducens TaxID=1324314 RepID=UPI00117D52C9|nr:hypothetical protein [Paenibacillus selenitireducens]